MWIGENVMALLQHNRMDRIQRALYDIGFVLFYKALVPTMFGVPQDRRRIYMCAVRSSRLGVSPARAHDIFHNAMQLMTAQQPMMAINDFFASPDHPHVRALLQHCATLQRDHAIQRHTQVCSSSVAGGAANEGAAPAKKLRGANWVSLHQQLGLVCNNTVLSEPQTGQVPTGSRQSLERYPMLRMLSMRELHYAMSQCPRLPEPSRRIIELSQSAGRHAPKVDIAGTIIPKGRLLDTLTGRLVAGVEKLRLQGVWLSDDVVDEVVHKEMATRGATMDDPDLLMTQLAGNSFDVVCLLATLMAGFVVIGSGPEPIVDTRAEAAPASSASSSAVTPGRAVPLRSGVDRAISSGAPGRRDRAPPAAKRSATSNWATEVLRNRK